MGKFQDLTGQKFGRLTPIKYMGQSRWLCKCECGNEKIISARYLKNRHISSCGCLQKEHRLKGFNKTHGKTKTRLYGIFYGIKKRCYNESFKDFNLYGARGIAICREWLDDFMNFYNWAINNGYQEKLTIDRIDVNGNYEPSNCRWVTKKQQANNRRNNKYITYNDETHTLSEWAEKFNIKPATLWARLNKGWSIERAFNK